MMDGRVWLGVILVALLTLLTPAQPAGQQPLDDLCMKATSSSVADHMYRDHKNYRKISQALYPSEGDHSLLLRIDLEWWDNATEAFGVRKSWIWSSSCLYSVLPLDLFPLLSIWVFDPQQRMKDVHVTLPPFCPNSTVEQANFALYSSLKRLEAYVRSRDDPDPDVGISRCVIAYDQNNNIDLDYSDEVGMDKAFLLLYLNLAGIGLLMLALMFLAIQFWVDWLDEPFDDQSDTDGTSYLSFMANSDKYPDDSSSTQVRQASVDGRGRITGVTTYGSAESPHGLREESIYDNQESDSDSEIEESGVKDISTGNPIYRQADERVSVLPGDRRNSRHRLHESEVVQIKCLVQRCRTRVSKLRAELAEAEDGFRQVPLSAATSLQVSTIVPIFAGEASIIEKEIKLCQAEASMLGDTARCSPLKAKELNYDFLMVKRELVDLRKGLWELDKASRIAKETARRRKKAATIWEAYLSTLLQTPLLCDLLAAAYLAFLVDFYISMLGPFDRDAVIPLLAVNIVCFLPWAFDFLRNRLGYLTFMICCSCFLVCERRSVANATIVSREVEPGACSRTIRKVNAWVLVPIAISLLLHLAFFLQWIALATMFDFAYSLEIICVLVVILFHAFMSIKLVLKVVRRVKEDEAESLRLAEKREITDMEAVFSGDYPSAEPSIEGAAARERQGLKWCPGPLRSLAVSWVWFLLMMLSLLAALVVFLVWLHTGYHTFAQQHIGLQLLLTAMTVVVLLLERQIVNLDMSKRGYIRSFPRVVRSILSGKHVK